MANSQDNLGENHDVTAEKRKKDHIDLAFASRTDIPIKDTRFKYEPLLSGHPDEKISLASTFLDKIFGAPIWISSMTGGTAHARDINLRLARMVGQFKLGMGLGSCRQLLYSDEFLADFAVRKHVGSQPLYANLGIAQVEYLLRDGQVNRIKILIDKLEADGLIIHINPMQEWLQPEGDRYTVPPIETISRLLDIHDYPIIVKEVGQGMGPQSLQSLLELPIAAIDFAAYGGTNFAALEIMRSASPDEHSYNRLPYIGHSAEEMVGFLNQLISLKTPVCNQIIISGGLSDFLDGFYLRSICPLPSIYGHASTFLKHAMKSYEDLETFTSSQIDGLRLAQSLLTVNKID
jgi:isopentenyl-diphosphate delta-isomerase